MSQTAPDSNEDQNGQVAEIRYVGQHDEHGRVHGFGCEVDAEGNTIAGRCGVWLHGSFVSEDAIPLCFLPADVFAEERACGAVLLWPNGEWYHGGLNGQNQPHGKGTLFFADGRVKEKGRFEQGEMIKGSRELQSGDTYDGEWKDGQRHGEGKRVRKSDGACSEGQWREGKLESGKRTFLNGAWQQGTFVDDELHGSACIEVFLNGNRYEGDMQRGKRDGVGRYQWKRSGASYEGQCAKNKRCGLGVQRNPDKSIFQCGVWKNDQFRKLCPVPRSAMPGGSLSDPLVTLLFPDGRTYRGPLNSEHQPHGVGSMHRLDGVMESRGDWVAGVLTGLGMVRYLNGDVYEGQLVNGQHKGFGILWNAEGKLLKCGEWGSGWIFELDSRPVPGRFLPFGEMLNLVARTASLIYPNTEFFVGPLNAQNKPHGEGAMYNAHVLIKQQGTWVDGDYTGPDDALEAPDVPVMIDPLPAPLVIDVQPSSSDAMDVDTPLLSKSAPATSSAIPAAGSMQLPVRHRRRAALCIGNNKYKPPPKPLPSCLADAKRMDAALKRLHFDSTIVLKDLDYIPMSNSIDSFITSLKQQRYGPGDLALLYYSGHGCELGRKDVRLKARDIRSQDANQGALSVQMIKRRFNRELKGVQVVIIADCCRVGETLDDASCFRCKPTAASSSSSSSSSTNHNSRVAPHWHEEPSHEDDLDRNEFGVVFSCDTGHSAFQDSKNGSIFTSLLIEQMIAPHADLTLSALLERTNKKMRSITDAAGKYQNAQVELSAGEAITLAASAARSPYA